MSVHFTSGSPETPGQTFNRLKRDWAIQTFLIELGKQQKELIEVFSVFVQNMQVRSGFSVFMPISRWQVNRDLIIHILCGDLLIGHVPKLFVLINRQLIRLIANI